MVDDDELDEPEPPAPADPGRTMRRLAAAILVQACLDLRFWNANTRLDAWRFLSPRDRRFREHLEMIVAVSKTDRRALDRYVSRFF